MQNNKKILSLNADTAFELLEAQAILVKKRNRAAEIQRQYRARKKQLSTKPMPSLRSNPRQIHYDTLVSNELEKIMDYNMADRVESVKKCFRTVMPYDSKVGKGPYIIQFFYNNCWFDWLEVRKPSLDPDGYGLFAMQDIQAQKRISLYLGIQYDDEDSMEKGTIDDTYVFQTFIKHDPRAGIWRRTRKNPIYVAPKTKTKKWTGGVDDMYLGAHLINTNKGPKRKRYNVATGNFLEIYSLKDIKRGEELIMNYHRK